MLKIWKSSKLVVLILLFSGLSSVLAEDDGRNFYKFSKCASVLQFDSPEAGTVNRLIIDNGVRCRPIDKASVLLANATNPLVMYIDWPPLSRRYKKDVKVLLNSKIHYEFGDCVIDLTTRDETEGVGKDDDDAYGYREGVRFAIRNSDENSDEKKKFGMGTKLTFSETGISFYFHIPGLQEAVEDKIECSPYQNVPSGDGIQFLFSQGITAIEGDPPKSVEISLQSEYNRERPLAGTTTTTTTAIPTTAEIITTPVFTTAEVTQAPITIATDPKPTKTEVKPSPTTTQAKTEQTTVAEPETTIADQTPSEDEAGLAGGAIAGILIGVLLGLVVSSVAGYFIFRTVKNRREQGEPQVESRQDDSKKSKDAGPSPADRSPAIPIPATPTVAVPPSAP